MRGLGFYAAHFPTCARGLGGGKEGEFLAAAPKRAIEVLLHDARTGAPVGWDANLNVATTTPSSLLVIPDVKGRSGAPKAVGSAAYALLDATSGRALRVESGWTLASVEVEAGRQPPFVFQLRAGRDQAFDLVDMETHRHLRWENNTMRVVPPADSSYAAWRIRRRAPPHSSSNAARLAACGCHPRHQPSTRQPPYCRVSNSRCPYWAAASRRRR